MQCRRIPFVFEDKAKSEIDNLVNQGILAPVTETTEWVIQMAIAEKSNGDIRICIDPQALKEALLREHFRLPTLDDVLVQLIGARIFRKLNVNLAC
ncbi:retrovirus-related Pol polyprotein from [Elysia marginata]|uniref:Retrovirus-related Pol polyprotein from n=1 Tax=Elysia marginata TaxID=1093978 RepID=A0AAV4J7F8_9GAST|nr:retrovirus-related Pol polyprotein from [Elysia marginata]